MTAGRGACTDLRSPVNPGCNPHFYLSDGKPLMVSNQGLFSQGYEYQQMDIVAKLSFDQQRVY